MGGILRATNTLFVNRESYESKSSIASQIVERLQHIRESDIGMHDPLIIFPEGGTTNGSQIIELKKGAFIAECAIQP